MKLLIEDDEGHRTVVPVIHEEITIGRREGHTIRLTERNVSRDHARIVKVDEQFFVEDVDARYGIRLNGSEIDGRTRFNEGDVIHIGDYRITLRPEDVQHGDGSAGRSTSPDSVVTRPQPKVGGAPDPDAPGPDESEPEDEDAEEFGALAVISRHAPGEKYELKSESLVIGRSDECDIVLDHRSVSSRHARVVREGGDYRIIDLDSSNGVEVDGERYQSVPLESGDVIGLGHVELRFVGPGGSLSEFSSAEAPGEVPRADEGSGEDRRVVVLGALGIVLVVVVAVVAILLHEPEQPDEAAASVAADADAQRSAGTSDFTDPESNLEGPSLAVPKRAESKRPGPEYSDSDRAESDLAELAASDSPASGTGGSDAGQKAVDEPEAASQNPSGGSAPTGANDSRQQTEPTPAEPTDEPKAQRGEPAPEALFRSATRKWVRGDPEGAIEDCSRALEAGYAPCYRVLGMAQEQMGNTREACRNFQEYMATEPGDARKIRRQMEQLGCRQAGAE